MLRGFVLFYFLKLSYRLDGEKEKKMANYVERIIELCNQAEFCQEKIEEVKYLLYSLLKGGRTLTSVEVSARSPEDRVWYTSVYRRIGRNPYFEVYYTSNSNFEYCPYCGQYSNCHDGRWDCGCREGDPYDVVGLPQLLLIFEDELNFALEWGGELKVTFTRRGRDYVLKV